MSHEFKTVDYFYCAPEIEIFFLINHLVFWSILFPGIVKNVFSRNQNDVLKCLLSTIQRYSVYCHRGKNLHILFTFITTNPANRPQQTLIC